MSVASVIKSRILKRYRYVVELVIGDLPQEPVSPFGMTSAGVAIPVDPFASRDDAVYFNRSRLENKRAAGKYINDNICSIPFN